MTETRVTVERLSLTGDGVAQGPVYVPQALPGEEVSGRLDGNRLVDSKIVTPSPRRVRPPCAHFKACGGCQMQHADDALVADWKVDVVRQALAGQGMSAPLRPIVTSPPRSRRRATFAVRRTRSGALAGFHRRASDAIVPVPDCLLVQPQLVAALPIVEALGICGGSRTTELHVAVTLSRNGLDIAVEGGKPLDQGLRSDLGRLAEDHRLARLTWNGEGVALRNPPVQRIGGADVVPPPGAFLQATAEGEAALMRAVAEALGSAEPVVDLFAGCGTFALPLAHDRPVHAVEGDAAMVAALDRAWRSTPGLRQVTSQARDLFRRPLLAQELSGFGGAVIDPPRAGAAAQVAELAGAGIPRIAYVSCNPVTFARDAKVLTAAGYGLEWVQVVDQFRWSSHVELAASFRLGS